MKNIFFKPWVGQDYDTVGALNDGKLFEIYGYTVKNKGRTKNGLTYIFTILLCLALFSCQNSTHKSDSDDYEYTLSGNEIAEDENTDNSLTLVPIIGHDLHVPLYLAGVALRKPSGEYLIFDNDIDYSYLTPYLIQFNYLRHCGHNLFQKIKNEPDKILTEFNKLYNAVKLYLEGRKSEIQDRELYSTIDKEYYNWLKDMSYFYQTYSSYNYKRYANEDGSFSRSVIPYYASDFVKIPQVTQIPGQAVIITF